MGKIKAIWERVYPILVSMLCTALFIYWAKINSVSLLDFEYLADCLGAVITFTSILLGFVGILLTSVVSIKHESKFIRYFFDKADKQYFKAVVSGNILSGAILALLSIIMFFAPELTDIGYYIQFLWAFSILYFVLTTHRLMNWLLTLLFYSDETNTDIDIDKRVNDNKRHKLQKKYKL